MRRFFDLDALGTTVATELRAGLVTFLSLSYIQKPIPSLWRAVTIGSSLDRWRGRAAVVTLVSVSCLASVSAHQLAFTETTLTLQTDARFEVALVVDLDALALGAPQDADDAALVDALTALSQPELDEVIDRLVTLFQRRVRVRFDRRPVPFGVSFPDRGTPRATESAIPTMLGLTARLTGDIPEAATDVEFFASRAFSDVHLTVIDELRGTTVRMVLERGARSDPVDLTGPIQNPSLRIAVQRYLRLGFFHIIPAGLDHVLFVLGIFLLSPRLRRLVGQVTAFTVAHALTLALGTFDLLTLAPSVVEPLIALSIAWVGAENVWQSRRDTSSRGGRWRYTVVFSCGLLHGLGFAGVLRELGLPAGERALGLVSFNVGIELGQLAVIAAAALVLGWYRDQPWYGRRVVAPASAIIAVVGMVWALERLLA